MIGLGSASQLGIGIAVVLEDKFSKTASRINTELKDMKKTANTAAIGAMRDYRNQQAVIASGAAVLSTGMYAMAKDGAQIQHTINQVAIIGGSKLGKTREQLAKVGADIGFQYARRPAEMAEALLENVRAGVTTNLAMITEYQTAAASITGEQLGGEEGVAKKLLGIQHAYGIASKDFATVANATAAVANLTMASIGSIGESMEYAAFTAHQFNIPLEETLALIGKLSQMGIEGSSSGVAMQNMISRLGESVGINASPKQQKAWASLGIDPNQIKPMLDAGRIFDVVAMVEAHSKGLGPSDRSSVLKDLLNVRGTRGALAAFGDPNNPQTSLANLKAGILAGERDDIARKQGKSATNDLASDMVRTQAKWDEFKRSFSEAAAPTLRAFLGVANRFIGFLDRIVKSPLGGILAGIASTLIPLIGVIAALKGAMIGLTLMAIKSRELQSVGGFGTLMMAGLGMTGLPGRMSNTASMANMIRGGAVRQNSAGRWIAGKGGTVWENTIKKGGQFMPKSFNPSASMLQGMAMGNSMASGSGIIGKLGGFLGKAGPFLGTVARFASAAFPIIGGILLLTSIATSIYDWLMDTDKEKEQQAPEDMERFYLRQLGRVMTPGAFSPIGPGDARQPFRESSVMQNLNIIIDGQKITKKHINKGWQDVDENFMLNNNIN